MWVKTRQQSLFIAKSHILVTLLVKGGFARRRLYARTPFPQQAKLEPYKCSCAILFQFPTFPWFLSFELGIKFSLQQCASIPCGIKYCEFHYLTLYTLGTLIDGNKYCSVNQQPPLTPTHTSHLPPSHPLPPPASPPLI